VTRLLARQFPPLHDPARASDQIRLPALARRPFAAQAQAITAALKVLATGRNPFFDAEVGTGKSTMALYVAATL
jgi:MoxR-like ATPase